MSDAANARTVVRIFLPWNDEKEAQWLERQERSGWHLEAVKPYGYKLEKGAPAEVAYRLDVLPARRSDRAEYFGLFHDAGWEHVGCRGLWQIFRKAVVNGEVPEIYTDPQSRAGTYRRLSGFLVAMVALQVTQIGPRLAEGPSTSTLSRSPTVFFLQLTLLAIFTYGLVRILLVMRRLRKSASQGPR
jgi:Protein of unknown function (DUF2812)